MASDEGMDVLEHLSDDALDSRDEPLEDLLGDVPTPARPRGRAPGAPDETAPIPGGGEVLELPDKALFDLLDKINRRHERLAKNRDEAGKHFDRQLAGCAFSYLEKSEDQSVWKAVLPPFVDESSIAPVPNKLADLRRKIVSQVLVDVPQPNPRPDGDSDRARGAADLARKFLRADGTTSGTDDAGTDRWALNLNMTRASAFAWYWVDKTAGGWRPKQIKADPQAVDPSSPFAGPQGVRTGDPILRYVGEQQGPPDPMDPTGQPTTTRVFVKDPAAAARQWLPKIRCTRLHPNMVRTIPATSTVFDAEMVLIVMWEPLAEAKRRFAVLNEMSDDELRLLARWRPKGWQRIVSPTFRGKNGLDGEAGELSADTPIFWYHAFCAISPDYVDGAEVAVSGAAGGRVLLRDTLRDDVETDDGLTVPVLRDIPLTQYAALEDPDGDPFGGAGVRDFAGGNELMAHIFSAVVEVIDQGLHPNWFITSTSPVTREDMTRRDGTPIEVLSADDMPKKEERAELPSFTMDVIDRLDGMLNSAAGTNETSNGLDSPYSVSGKAKEVAIQQAKVALSQYYGNYVKARCRAWLIKLQLAQGRLTVPQIVKLVGDEAAYKQRWFVGADLLGVSEVPFKAGTGTMMAPAEKVNYLRAMQDGQWLDPATAGEVARASMSDDLGLEKNVHEERIDRAIADWSEGPPPGWLEAQAANEQATQQRAQQVQMLTTQLAQVSGMPPEEAAQMAEQQVPPPQLQPVFDPFTPRPNDEEPAVAKIQQIKLSRVVSTPEYTKHPLPWRQLVDRKYQTACYAAGVTTVRQQFEAQQAAAQQQAAAAQANADADRQAAGAEAEATRQQASAEADKDRAHASQEAAAADQRKGVQAIQQEGVRAALNPPAPTA